MSKLERLLKLLAVLLDTERPLTAEDLRRKIGGYPDADASFRRAFERDKDDLRKMGVELLVETVPGTDPPIDGYRIDPEEYAGRDPGLEPDELAALHLAAALVRLDAVGEDAFWKLGGGAGVEASPIATMPSSDDAAALYEAITERRLATFGYRGELRTLEPAHLSFRRGHWYVSGHDRDREAERVFRLDRIDGEIRFGDAGAFEAQMARGPEVTRTWEIGDAEPVTTRVEIDAAEAVWARVHLSGPEIVDERDDGSVVVELNVRNVDAFRDWVIGFAENAVVESPESMRRVVIDWLEAI